MIDVRPLICSLLILIANSALALDQGKKHILFLSSYTPSFPTFYEQLSGLSSEINPEQIQVDLEFLDAKRFGHIDPQIQHTLEYKLQQLPPYDLVISGDEAATEFVTQRRYGMFANIPIVFLGVNDIDFGLSFNDDPQVTGVLEKTSIEDTLILIQDLLGSEKPVLVITDATPTGLSDMQRFHIATQHIDFQNYDVLSLANHSFDEMLKQASALRPPASILLISSFVDRSGESRDFLGTLQQLRANTHVPIFHLWHHGLGEGIFGGKLISHFELGRTAAGMALKILNGTPVSALPVATESANRFLFDYNEVRRFGFSERQMPRDSRFINQPAAPDRTALYLLLAGIACTILTVTLLWLMIRMQIRKTVAKRMHKANRKLEQQIIARTQALEIARLETENLLRLRNSILENSLVGIILVKNGQVEWINQHMETLFGYSPAEMLGKGVDHLLVSREAKERFNQQSGKALERGNAYEAEYALKHKNGRPFWCIISSKALNPEDVSEGILYIVMEINSRKLIEDELKSLNHKLELQATTDYLTGLYNRRFVKEKIESEIGRSDRYKSPFSVILLDIDHFKSINDRFGHNIGDQVLIALSELLRTSCRQVDTIARWGGEEFLILCPATDLNNAATLAELLRKRVEKHRFRQVNKVTASFGVAWYLHGQSIESLIKTADDALYEAKETRNTVATRDALPASTIPGILQQ